MISRSERKREQILKAAGKLFAEHGYGVSMDAISKAANVSKQTVYAHFKTKDLLFETCIQSKCVSNRIDENAFNTDAPLREVLLEFGIRFQNMLLDEGVQQTYRNAISQLELHPDLASLYLESGPKTTNRVLSDYLSRKIDLGELSLQGTAEEGAMQLLLLFHGKAVYWANLGEDSGETLEERAAYIESCVDLFLKGNGHRV
ncbi:TetR/AcrR family transcriptional regulator [Vibrio comitans]|uniref:TetR family transcriptional regulator n=1 Tax=Vibrio comitans NBRC 102076 TaxID=1219078 RepID=A0A4Y3ILL0_9VIBR|nr:TetR/AcrR family transcriptional regulator [Vibrio comitans]GEA59882.1 TetR family transcriptional regulator [Vibrio comitans NBRC 102076]